MFIIQERTPVDKKEMSVDISHELFLLGFRPTDHIEPSGGPVTTWGP